LSAVDKLGSDQLKPIVVLGRELLPAVFACILGLLSFVAVSSAPAASLVIWFFPIPSLNHQKTQINQKN
jgi:hypothetical protein